MLGLLLGLAVLVASWAIGVCLDAFSGVKSPPIYWTIGAVGGLVGMFIILSS